MVFMVFMVFILLFLINIHHFSEIANDFSDNSTKQNVLRYILEA
jgi:hypothetical protein